MRLPWRRRDREAELDREIQDHLDLEREDQQRAGLSPDAAQRAARRAFGNPATTREDVREAWGGQWLERLWLDTRLAIRMWLRTPGLSAVAILTIGLGVGAATALVSQLSAVFWTPLPVASPQDLRFVAWTSPRRPFVLGINVLAGPQVNGADTFGTVSYPAFRALRDDATSVSDVACWSFLGEARPVILGELGFGTVQFVSGNYFRMLGVRAAIGRTIEPHDESAGGWSPVAMVSHRFWQRTLGGSADVTNRTLRLNGRPFAIVGVMPEGFFGLDPSISPDVVVPNGAVVVAAATQNPLQNPGLWNVCRIVARLAPGASDEAARIDLERVLASSIAAVPPAEPYDAPRVLLLPAQYGQSTLREGTALPLAILLIVVGGLLLAACANIAGLLFARGSARAREIATRLALGASRRRVVRQLITESLILSLAGGGFGLVLAYWWSGAGGAVLSQFMPTLFGADRTLGLAATLDARVLAFGLALTVLSGLSFGVWPAIRATRLDLIAVIKDNTSCASRSSVNVGRAMVAAQAALAVFLLVGALLFVRTVSNLRAVDFGFDADRLLYAWIEPRSGGIADPEKRKLFFEDAVARLRALPGVVAAGATGSAPLGGDVSVGVGNFTFTVCGSPSDGRPAVAEPVSANLNGPGYFPAMGMPIVDGRDFTSTDVSNTQRAGASVIVNEAFARRFFPGHSAVGQSAVLANDCAKPVARPTIIGVVADSLPNPRAARWPAMYLQLGGYTGPVTLVVRTAGPPAAMIPSVRRAMTEINAETPTFSEAPVVDLIERSVRRERLLSSVLAVFAIVTVLICALGIYAVLSYSVERRRQEISVRMAIGASSRDVVALMVRESVLPVGLGVIAGAALAVGANRWLAGMLYGVTSADPYTLIVSAAIFVVVALAAAAIPSRAAARVDPVLALRQ